MKFNLKQKFVMSFTVIILLTGLITSIIGTVLINKGVINQVKDKVRTDLDLAVEILNNRTKGIEFTINFSVMRNSIKNALIRRDKKSLKKYLQDIRKAGDIEILTITDNKGNVILRSCNPSKFGDSQADDKLIKNVLLNKKTISSPVIIQREELRKESEKLSNRAHIKFIPTLKAKKIDAIEDRSGMVLKAAAPIWGNNGSFIGILYGGCLINRNSNIVDKVKDTVYKSEKYNNIDIGGVSIFQNDVRITTNVMTYDGKRAIGTRVCEGVSDKVIGEGLDWIDRAFVVNLWYITAYKPIKNIDRKIIGMIGLGILEQKFVDIRRNTLLVFFGITIIGMILVLIVSNIIAYRITSPINYLVKVSKKISEGDYFIKVDVKTGDELGELENTFNNMAIALRERDEKLKKAMMELEKISRTDPLTGILNRRAFWELAGIELNRAGRLKNSFSLAYIDLDDFKNVNDNLGHSAGDKLLCSVAETIKNNIREIDIFSRLGGDEFVILFSGMGTESVYSVINKLHEKLLHVMNKNGWPVTFSIGIVTYNSIPDNISQVIKKADETMYSAKQNGKNMIKYEVVE